MKKSAKLYSKILIFLLLLTAIAACSSDTKNENSISPRFDDGAYVDSEGRLVITQFGVTWQFDKEYTYGQFANGDYWIVGPVRIIKIYPVSITASGRTMNGSMLNPVPGNQQGYDSSIGDTYSAALNVNTGISSSNPLVLQAGTSLVSTISLANAVQGNRSQLQTAAVLTVLSSAPAAGSFRPAYCGTDKTVQFNANQLNYTLLKSLAPVANTPALQDVERYFERVWLDHIAGWTGRALHPVENMPDYGTIIASEVSEGALMLHLNFTDEQKTTLLIRYVQLGIDNFGIIQSGGKNVWEPDGGHCSGRKWPILFAGLMLNNAEMINIGQKSGDYLYSTGHGPGNLPPDYVHFQEDGQTFFVKQSDVDIATHYYPPERVNLPGYSSSEINMPEWGIRHSTFPSWDGNAWNVTYRALNAYSWIGFVLSARIMNAITAWNNKALFEYEDRHMAVTASGGLTPSWRYNTVSSYTGDTLYIQDIWASNAGSWRSTSRFIENMWDAYRDQY